MHEAGKYSQPKLKVAGFSLKNTAGMGGTMNKEKRLKKRREFVRVYSSGKSLANNAAVIYWLENRGPVTRVGFSANKRLGKAVLRNRIKRQFREAFRLNAHKVRGGMDIVFVARRSAVRLEYKEIEAAILNLLQRADLLLNEE